MAFFGSSWLEDDDEDIGPLSHWKDGDDKKLDDDSPVIKHFQDDKQSYQYVLKTCPGYEGHRPANLDHEVCKHCGNIHYYH